MVFRAAYLTLFAALALNGAFPQIKDWNSLRIRMERTPCYGPCPVYSVEVHGNGDVFYYGDSGTILIRGHHRDRLPHTTVLQLFALFQKADYFSLRDKYEGKNPDAPGLVTSIAFDKYYKTVMDLPHGFAEIPEAARQLDSYIDQVTGDSRWLEGNNDTVPSLLREHWNFKANASDNDKLFVSALSRRDILTLYLEKGFPPLQSPDPAESPLVTAAYYGSPALLVRLANQEKRLPDPYVTCALSAAALSGDLGSIHFFLARGASPEGTGCDAEPTPLINAILSGKAAAVSEILKYHPDVEKAGRDDEAVINTLLNKTLDKSQAAQILSALINAGADVNARDYTGQTPVFHAEEVDLLTILVKAGADVNARDEYGRTPLMTCFDLDYAKALMALGADVSARDQLGETAADTARQMGDTELFALLEAAMAVKSSPH